jgi:hypothetical protein
MNSASDLLAVYLQGRQMKQFIVQFKLFLLYKIIKYTVQTVLNLPFGG